jgi:hypothetical protein
MYFPDRRGGGAEVKFKFSRFCKLYTATLIKIATLDSILFYFKNLLEEGKEKVHP